MVHRRAGPQIHEDVFGVWLRDAAGGNPQPELVERDDGFIAVPSDYSRGPERMEDHERAALELAAGHVLDVGCGGGRHTLYLQERGHDVLAIDASRGAVEVARQNGVRVVSLLRAEEVGRLAAGSYDTVLLLGNNVGLLRGRSPGRRLLAQFDRLTGPEGIVLGESVDPSAADAPEDLAYHERNRELGRMPGQLRLRLRYRRLASRYFDYLFMSPRELEELCVGTRWRVAGHFPAARPGKYVAVLRKR